MIRCPSLDETGNLNRLGANFAQLSAWGPAPARTFGGKADESTGAIKSDYVAVRGQGNSERSVELCGALDCKQGGNRVAQSERRIDVAGPFERVHLQDVTISRGNELLKRRLL